MSLISQTRLRRTSTGQDVLWCLGIVRNIASVWAALPPQQVPPDNEKGDYRLIYDLRCSAHVRALGIRRDGSGHLVIDCDVWETAADREARQRAVFQNTFVFSKPKSLSTPNLRAYIRNNIRNVIEDAVLTNRLGYQADPRIAVDGNHSGEFWQSAEVQLSRDLILDVDTAVSNPTGAPQRTNPETGE